MSAEVVMRARAGDRLALERLLATHTPAVRARLAADISSAWQSLISADDVLQHSWLDAFLRISTLEASDEPGFAAWFLRLAQNNLRDAIRRLDADKRGGNARRVSPLQSGQSATLTEALFGVDSQTPSRVAIREETEHQLRAALQQLPEHYQTVIRRYDLEGRSAAEVAAELGRSSGAVHLLRIRAHELLRRALTMHFEKTGNSA